jgi:hypothetical protein
MNRIATIFVVAMFSHLCTAQNSDRISVSYQNAPLQSLIDQVEKETPYRFFYISSWIDSSKVSATISQASVQDILSTALTHSGVSFFVDGSKIILTLTEIDKEIDLSQPLPRAPVRFEREMLPAQNGGQNIVSVKEIGKRGASPRAYYTLSGYVREKKSGEPLTGALVYTKALKNPVGTDPLDSIR